MTRMGRLFSALAVGALGTLLPLPAEACSCAEVYAVSPAPDAGAVPTNTWVRVTGTGVPELTFTQADGGVVDVEIREPLGDARTRYLVPREPLAKGAEYVVADEFQELSRFVVTADADTSGPEFIGLEGAVFRESSTFEPQSSCGPSRTYSLTYASPEEDATPPGELFFNVYAGTSPDNVDLSRPALVLPPGIKSLGQSACGPFFDLEANPEPWVVITAVDRAGNESAPGDPRQLTMGCGCSAGSAGAPFLLGGLLVLLGRLRRRRS